MVWFLRGICKQCISRLYVYTIFKLSKPQYFEDKQMCEEIKNGTGYKKTTEKAHGQIEIREYYQTEDTAWMHQKKQWKGLKSIGMEKKTIRKGETEKEEYRYYISSLCEDIELFSRVVKGTLGSGKYALAPGCDI